LHTPFLEVHPSLPLVLLFGSLILLLTLRHYWSRVILDLSDYCACSNLLSRTRVKGAPYLQLQGGIYSLTMRDFPCPVVLRRPKKGTGIVCLGILCWHCRQQQSSQTLKIVTLQYEISVHQADA
jgi:hypothetical protein